MARARGVNCEGLDPMECDGLVAMEFYLLLADELKREYLPPLTERTEPAGTSAK